MRPKMTSSEEDAVLYRKLVKSILGIILVLTVTVLGLQFLGPKVFSIFGLLSIDRFKSRNQAKVQTPSPILVDVKKATKEKTITVNGFSESGAKVFLYINGPEAGKTTADSDGKFTFNNLELLEGQNILFAKAQSDKKTISERSEIVYITYDIKKPDILIIYPKNGEEIRNVDSRITVKGTVDEKAQVYVNSHLAIVGTDGNFEALVSLKEDVNKILISAMDEAGNEASASVSVTYHKK